MSEYIIECEYDFDNGWIPGEHREEIVRCRDCKHAWPGESGKLRCNGYLVAPWDYYNDEPSMGEVVTPDGFCAWAERREP